MSKLIAFVAPEDLREGQIVLSSSGLALMSVDIFRAGGLAQGVADGVRVVEIPEGVELPTPGSDLYLGPDRRPTGENTGARIGRVHYIADRHVTYELNGR